MGRPGHTQNALFGRRAPSAQPRRNTLPPCVLLGYNPAPKNPRGRLLRMPQSHKSGSSTGRTAMAVLALFAYLVTGAIVPAGYMAAPTGTGAPFHLCPDDARSAVLIQALGQGSEGHHHQHHSETGGESSSAESGCLLSGVSAAPMALALPAASMPPRISSGAILAVPLPPPGASWLRPPPRSPPA